MSKLKKILLVLEAPTQEDIEAGGVSNGRDVRMLRKLMSKKDGFDKVVVHATTVFTSPLTKASLKNDGFSAALEDFRLRIAGETADVVVAVGGVALTALTGQTSIMDWRGYLMENSDSTTFQTKVSVGVPYKTKGWHKDKTTGEKVQHFKGDLRYVYKKVDVAPVAIPCSWIIPVITPETVRKSGLTLMSTMDIDLDRVVRAATGRLNFQVVKPYKTEIDPNEISTKYLAIDIETDRHFGRITDIGVADRQNTWSVKSSDYHFGIKALPKINTIYAHNAAFEYEHMVRAGLVSQDTNVWCTMLAAFMLDPNGRKGLNWVISRYLDTKRHKHLAGKDFELYNALDVRRGYDLVAPLAEGLRKTGQFKFFNEGMMPAIPTLVHMHNRGLKLDMDYVNKWAQELNEARAKIPVTIRMLAKSPKQLAKHLGAKKVDDEALKRMKMRGHALAADIDSVLHCRGIDKQLATYCTPAIGKPRLFPYYLPGARDMDLANKGIAYSGRPTAHSPNIQNQPPVARRMFVADNGYKLISLDWSQIEPRIAAIESMDDVLADDLEKGIYEAVAEAAGCDRSTAKTLWLLSAYLGSPRTLQAKLMVNGVRLELKKCEQLQARLFARYNAWAQWRQGVISKAKDHGFLTNSFGKWAPFPADTPAKAVNFIPQSSAACILWYCLPQVEMAIQPYNGEILTTVHDEILIQVPFAHTTAAAHAARSVMEQKWPQLRDNFIPTKTKVGDNWADMTAENSFWGLYQ